MAVFRAIAARGTEAVLAEELRELKIDSVEPGRGVVAFGTELTDAYRACLWSRIASRVLYPLTSFEALDAAALYAGIHAIDWPEHLEARNTLAVDTAGKDAPAGPPHFVALKAKDAIVDRIREREGARPSIDTARPDLRVNLHLAGSQVTVNIDLSGRGLHRRGGSRVGAAAPLKENLAAAILRLAGWSADQPGQPLYDPMCGSATLLIEAAWVALDVAPGLERERIGAEGWRGHRAAEWNELLQAARERQRTAADRTVRIAGSDASAVALRAAQEATRRLGLTHAIGLDQTRLQDAKPPWDEPGLVVTNPPYGERLGESGELGPLYESLGNVLRRRFPGWSAWVFTGNPALGKRIGLRPQARHVLYNGPIEARLLSIPISAKPVAGTAGPGWRRASDSSRGFAGRLRKNLERLRPWAEEEGLTCYRVYDADLPEYNVAIDRYDRAVRIEEYARPRKVEAEVAEQRLRDVMLVVPEALGVSPEDVVLRVRRKRVPGEQHERRDEQRRFVTVREGRLRFDVNLNDYLDTGLFLDDRLLRLRIGRSASGRRFLNLFAYSCTASVAAAVGGARSTTSVDLSKTYLAWGRRNFALNGVELGDHRFLREDVVAWLRRGGDGQHHDLIFLAPPTYSRSKAMREEFDLQRDHVPLIERASRLLAPEGELLFSANLRSFVLDEAALRGLRCLEITEEITPRDFKPRPRLRAWSIRSSS